MKRLIHVAQDAIRANVKDGGQRPAIILRDHRGATRHSELELVTKDGTVIGRFVYSPNKPLSCGARLWLELDSEVCDARPV